VYLERGRLVTVAVTWKTQLESGGGSLPTLTINKKKRWQLQKAGTVVYWRKQKGHASKRTLNKQSLQQPMADSRRQVSHSLRETFTKLSPGSPFFSLPLMRQHHQMLNITN
jgi:hypothetical protein